MSLPKQAITKIGLNSNPTKTLARLSTLKMWLRTILANWICISLISILVQDDPLVSNKDRLLKNILLRMRIKLKMSKENLIKYRFATSSTIFTQMKTQDLKWTFLMHLGSTNQSKLKVDTITIINECKKWHTIKGGVEKISWMLLLIEKSVNKSGKL